MSYSKCLIELLGINFFKCFATSDLKSLEQAQQNIRTLGWQLSDGEITELDKAAASTDKKMVQNIVKKK